MRRTITHIEWATGKFAGRTFIRLDCSHERSIGGHVFLSGKSPRVGQEYECREHGCGRMARGSV